MTQFSSLKNSSSGKNFFGVMLVVALAIHGAVLGIPTDSKPKISENAKTEEKKDNDVTNSEASASSSSSIKSTKSNSTQTSGKPVAKKSLPRPPLKSVSQTSKSTTASKSNSKPTTRSSQATRAQTSSSRPKSSTLSTSKSSTSKSSSTTSANSTKKTGASNQPSSNSRQVQNSTNSNTKTPQNQLSNQQRIINKPNQNSTITPTKPLNDGTQSPLVNNFYKEIPYYFGSLLTARGILKSDFSDLEKYRYIYSTTDPLDKVDREFKQQLETKGFIVNEETKESNFIVYKFSKDGKDSFLHLVHKNDRTAIFIDDKSYKLEDLENKPPKIAKFYDVFKENIRDNSDLHLERIKKPDIEALHQTEVLKNLKKQTEEVEIDRLLLDTLQVTTSSTQPIEMKQLAETITTELGKGDEIFTVTKVEGYGDDNLNLYEVTQKDFKIYMILVSIPDLKKVSSQGGLPIKSDLGVRIWQKLSSQSPQLVTQGDRLMKIAILFYQKDPRE